jgi:hypothetical protein
MPTFGYEAVLKEKTLAPYQRSYFGLKWVGLFLVKEPGLHVFSVINPNINVECKTSITLDNQPLLTLRGRLLNRSTIDIALDLNSGLYNLQIWFICSTREEQVSFQLWMRGPHDPMVAPIPLDRFLHAR